jgi:hypothetical protein
MVADMLAGTFSMIRAETESSGAGFAELPKAQTTTPGHLAFLELDVDALRELKRGFDALRRLEIEQRRELRAAARGTSPIIGAA